VWTQQFGVASPSNADHTFKQGYSRDYNDFGPTLQDYLRRLGLPPECPSVICRAFFLFFFLFRFSEMRAYDFGDAAVALVTSVPGVHREASALRRYGYPRLAQVLSLLRVFFFLSHFFVRCWRRREWGRGEREVR
jgi:hypothetical protein